MVAQLAAMPIVTAVGEFAAPYLLRKAGEIGLTRFIQVYGSAAAAAIGIQKTQPVDLQTEKILGMPVSRITGQGEVYDDIDYSYIDEDKENDEVPTKTTEEKLTEPTEPEPPEDPDVGADLAAEAAIHTTKKLLEDKKTKDITKQTEELVSDIEEDDFDWGKSIENANKNYPKLQIQNLKKIVEADKHFGAAAMSFEGYEESQLIYLTPQEYLDLTKQFRRTDWDIKSESIKDLEKIISEGKELANIPTLYVKKEGDNYSVSGQEGGHRAQAFKNLGYDLIPTVIQGTGKDKVADIENKVYTATKRSYLYTEDWTQDHIGFIPKNIISKSNYNEDTKEYEDTEVKSVKPEDFYSVRSKKKLFVENDITKQTEELVKKELSVSQQTKNLTSKIKNKITTWEDHFPTIEEATKAAKDVGGTLKEFEEGLIEKKITFKRIGTSDYTVYYDGKEVAELAPLEEKYKGVKEYNIKFMGEIDASDVGTGLAESKALVKKYIVDGLLDKSEPSRTPGLYWEPLRKTFQEATFDKKGNYVEFPEPAHTEKELEELVERVNKNK